MEHAPVLLILLPLAGAIAVAVTSHGNTARAHAVASVAAGATAMVAWALLAEVTRAGARSYELAGWPAPWGIELRADRVGAFGAAVVATLATLSVVWSRRSVQSELGDSGSTFYTLAMLALTGLLGMCVTGDAFNLFVFLEVASLTGYAMVAGPWARSRLAAFRYLVLGAVGTSLYLLGVGYLYVATGTLNLADLTARIAGHEVAPVAMAFVVCGLALKMGLFPLHAWVPDAYGEAPSATVAFAAPVVTKVMALALLRFVHQVFGADMSFGPISAGSVLAWAGAVAVVVGAAVAAAQRDFRRLLAWSSISNIGYIALGIGLGTDLAVAAALLHVLNHALMKGVLFYVAGSSGSRSLSDLAGLTARMPVTAVCLVVAAMSAAGIPPTGGFFSKWYLLSAALDAGQPALCAAVVAGSLLAAIYAFRVVEAARAPGGDRPAGDAPALSLVPMVAATLGILAAGLLSAHLVSAVLSGVLA